MAAGCVPGLAVTGGVTAVTAAGCVVLEVEADGVAWVVAGGRVVLLIVDGWLSSLAVIGFNASMADVIKVVVVIPANNSKIDIISRINGIFIDFFCFLNSIKKTVHVIVPKSPTKIKTIFIFVPPVYKYYVCFFRYTLNLSF